MMAINNVILPRNSSNLFDPPDGTREPLSGTVRVNSQKLSMTNHSVQRRYKKGLPQKIMFVTPSLIICLCNLF